MKYEEYKEYEGREMSEFRKTQGNAERKKKRAKDSRKAGEENSDRGKKEK